MELWLGQNLRACKTGEPMAVVTAQEIFGLAQGDRVRLKRTMADMIFQFVASNAPAAAAAIKAIDEQIATVVTADDEEGAIRVDEPSSLSAQGSRPGNHHETTVT